MHKLLQRQIRQAASPSGDGLIDYDALLERVSAAYEEVDRERRVLAHAHHVMREEYGALNTRLSRLRDAIAQMGAGFAIWDHRDRLVLSNGRLAELLPHIADLMKPGVPFADFVREGMKRRRIASGPLGDAVWVADRLEQHGNPRAAN